jgi:hypothetical protein
MKNWEEIKKEYAESKGLEYSKELEKDFRFNYNFYNSAAELYTRYFYEQITELEAEVKRKDEALLKIANIEYRFDVNSQQYIRISDEDEQEIAEQALKEKP